MLTVRSLTAILTYAIALCGIVPLFPWLSLTPRLFLVAGLAAGLWQDRFGLWPLKNWLLNSAIVPVFVFYALQVSRANPVQPVVSGLAVVLAVRLLGEKSIRHILQIHVLSLFCLAASSLFDLSPLFLAYLGLLLFLVAVALVLLCFHSHDPQISLSSLDLRRVVAAGLLIPLASVPLLILFFPILPRTQMPMWDFHTRPTNRTTGFSDKVAPGESASLAESGQLAFRAELPRQAEAQLYWRGIVLNRVEGNRWLRDPKVPEERLAYGRRRIRQVIYSEPGASTYLLGLDVPVRVNAPRVTRAGDGIFEMRAASGRRQHYEVESADSGEPLKSWTVDRDFYLQLPADLPATIRQLGEGIQAPGGGDTQILERLEAHFAGGGYRYTMQEMPTGGQALEEFLFTGKQGNCEFFASAFGLLARVAGLPARLVGGYLGGEYNELGRYYLVGEKTAHAWVEVFIDGQGWQRVDPSSFASNAASIWGRDERRGLVRQLRLLLDSLDHAWNRSVITYDFDRQASAARELGKRLQHFRPQQVLGALWRPVLGVTTGGLVILLLVNRRRWWLSPEERLLRKFYRRLERQCRIKVREGEQGLFELAALTGNAKVQEFVSIYAAAIYHDRSLTTEELTRLRQLLAEGFGDK